jgi:hypothetical protein
VNRYLLFWSIQGNYALFTELYTLVQLRPVAVCAIALGTSAFQVFASEQQTTLLAESLVHSGVRLQINLSVQVTAIRWLAHGSKELFPVT